MVEDDEEDDEPPYGMGTPEKSYSGMHRLQRDNRISQAIVLASNQTIPSIPFALYEKKHPPFYPTPRPRFLTWPLQNLQWRGSYSFCLPGTSAPWAVVLGRHRAVSISDAVTVVETIICISRQINYVLLSTGWVQRGEKKKFDCSWLLGVAQDLWLQAGPRKCVRSNQQHLTSPPALATRALLDQWSSDLKILFRSIGLMCPYIRPEKHSMDDNGLC